MNLRGFLKQTVTVNRMGGTNRWGERVKGGDETYPARKEIKQNRIRSQQGTEVLASTVVMMLEELQIDDLIDGDSIQDRENMVNIAGKIIGWRYYL